MTGPIQDAQLVHYGLKVSVAAVLDKATLEANKGRVPAKYRGMVSKLSEVRFSPSIFIPDTLFISPKVDDTQMWGISWTPFGLGLTLAEVPRVRLGADLRLTYAFIGSDRLGDTHFLRPGIDLNLDVEIPVTETFLVSVGWTSQVYIPQKVGGGVLETGPFEDTIWHIGQAYLMLHFRFPYTTHL
ncbi:MAG: hypothetical protein EP329_09515 [Deltaproteobacteria bacterium]|nr:MAG: hypothetical protein EP329_09515 [Deltaproteobacteria bacterium]